MRLSRRQDRGAAAVELAIVLPVLLLVLFGLIDFGRAFNANMALTQAAREGARVAALGGDFGQVQKRTWEAATFPGGGSAGVTVTVCVTSSSGLLASPRSRHHELGRSARSTTPACTRKRAIASRATSTASRAP